LEKVVGRVMEISIQGEGDLPLVQLSIHKNLAVNVKKFFVYISETTKPTIG
jgi:hypothetical protein